MTVSNGLGKINLYSRGGVRRAGRETRTPRQDTEALSHVVAYVQGVAEVDSSSDADAIIESAGMTTRKVTLHDRPELAAKQGAATGAVLLVAKAAAKRAAYTWQYSLDQKTWTTMPVTMQAKASVSGLTAATLYYFRVQALTTAGLGDWSQTVALLVK